MKLIILITCVLTVNVSATVYSQNSHINIDVKNKSIREILKVIEKQSQFRFFYNDEFTDLDKTVSIAMENTPIEDILSQIFRKSEVTFRVMDNNFVVITPTVAAQERTITGVITDSKGEPLTGVNVVIEGTTIGVITDAKGEFSIKVPNENSVLVFSYVGYLTEKVTAGNQRSIELKMVEDIQSLQEVVVTALGIKRSEKTLGYSVQKISGDQVQLVKGVDVGTSLTGKVAGLMVKNSTEFFEAPTILLRGQNPLLIVDGVPYGNGNLRDISPDNIASMDVLKGATASALYGSRGGSGAIIITTKKGADKKGLSISVNSNTMFFSGFLALPKVQSSYSSGYNGEYNTDDYVWGDKLDIGRRAEQWNPLTKDYEEMELTSRGKNNFKNFLESSFLTNNNISVTQTGENGSFRASVSHMYNKGQYPNSKADIFNYSIGGEMKFDKKFSMEGSMSYNNQNSPQISGKGYGAQGYIYNMLVWTGPEYDVTQYRDYWVVPDQQQNWHYNYWYDNPYFMAYEKLQSINKNKFNAYLSAKYNILPGVNMVIRSGLDYYYNKETRRNPPGVHSTREWNSRGMYSVANYSGYSLNNDLIIMSEKKLGNFNLEGLVGGTIYYYLDEKLSANTKNGLSVPGFYSLKSSVESPTVDAYTYKKQVNSLFAKATIGYQNTIFVDITGRNDWTSTLPESTRSYFYPSVGTSIILSEFLPKIQFLNYWKLRGSWTVSKKDLGVYETNKVFSINTAVWDNLNSAAYPVKLKGDEIEPEAKRTFEIGTNAIFLNKRVQVDFTYYNSYRYNRQVNARMSSSTGFQQKVVNTGETTVQKGLELTLGLTPVKKEKIQWDVVINWSMDHEYYKKLDPVYSADNPWTKVGERTDVYSTYDWERDPYGNVIHNNGFPIESDYATKIGYGDPDWVWGLSNSFRFGNFTFGVSLDGRVGGLTYNGTSADLWHTGAHPDSDNQWRYDEVVNKKLTFVGDGVTLVSGDMERDKYGRIIQGTDTRVFAKNDRIVSYEKYIMAYGRGRQNIVDPTFFKIREISVAYNIPKKAVSIIRASSASIALTGQNVFLWTKKFKFADPDIDKDDLNSPSYRYLGVNLKLNF